MVQRIFLVMILVLVIPGWCSADQWISPDGTLRVTTPDAAEFDAIPNPPKPFLGLWISNDESMRFGVMKLPIPNGVRLIQSSAEEGLAEEIGGQVRRLPNREQFGVEIWSMSGKGESSEITQSIFQLNGSLYKVMAVTVHGPANRSIVEAFIASLSIAEPTPVDAERQAELAQTDTRSVFSDSHIASKMLGAIGALGLLAVLVFYFVRRKI